MSKLTKQQQDELAEQLDRMYGPIYLRCDGYLVFASLIRAGKNKLAIAVYVNGYIKGKWIGSEVTEEGRRFYRPIVRSTHRPKFVKAMEKIQGKRKCKKDGYYDKWTFYSPHWSLPRPFIRHIIKHNESIEVLDHEAYKAAIEALPKDED